MTVILGHDDGVSIQDYHCLVGTGDCDIDSDAFDWLGALHPGRRWILDRRIYRTTRAINMPDSGQQVEGNSSSYGGTQILAKNFDQPIFNLGANHQKLSNFLAGYIGDSAVTNPASNGIEAGQNWNNSEINNVWFNRVYSGLVSPEGGVFFSNNVQNLRVSNWAGWGVRLEGSGTGNVFQNTYINTGNDAEGGFYSKNMSEGHISQINVEAASLSRNAFEFERSSWSVDSLHVEGVSVPNMSGYLYAHGDRTNITINNPTFSRLAQPAGNRNALFHIGGGSTSSGRIRDAGTQINANGTIVKDNSGTVQGELYEAMGDLAGSSRDAILKMSNTQRAAGSQMALDVNGNKLRSYNLSDRAFRKFDDEWYSMQDSPDALSSNVYRFTVDASGSIQAALT